MTDWLDRFIGGIQRVKSSLTELTFRDTLTFDPTFSITDNGTELVVSNGGALFTPVDFLTTSALRTDAPSGRKYLLGGVDDFDNAVSLTSAYCKANNLVCTIAAAPDISATAYVATPVSYSPTGVFVRYGTQYSNTVWSLGFTGRLLETSLNKNLHQLRPNYFEVATSSATPTTLLTMALPVGTGTGVLTIIGERASGATDTEYRKEVKFAYRRVGSEWGTHVTDASTDGRVFLLKDAIATAWAADYSISGGSLVATVTGAAATNINWQATVALNAMNISSGLG